MADYYGNNDWRDYLAHHGILGQKWGKRNGPPYPLDGSDHSASEKKAGWRKSLGGGESSSVRKKRRYITKETKRASKRYDKEIRKSDKEVTRAGKKYEKAAAKGSGSVNKKRELYEDAKRDNEFTKRLKDKELDRISKMTSKDIAEEKKLVKKNQAERRRNVQKEGFIGGAIDNKISGKKKDEVKSKNRVSDSERNQLKEDIAKKPIGASAEAPIRGGVGEAIRLYRKAKKLGKSMNDVAREEKNSRHDKKSDFDFELNELEKMEAEDSKKRQIANSRTSDWPTISSEKQTQMLSNARTKDRWSIDFLEAIQNKEILYNHDTNAMLREYKKYLANPEDYWKTKLDKLPDV